MTTCIRTKIDGENMNLRLTDDSPVKSRKEEKSPKKKRIKTTKVMFNQHAEQQIMIGNEHWKEKITYISWYKVGENSVHDKELKRE